MNRLLALGILLLLAGQVLAQQKPQYTQYPLNNYLLTRPFPASRIMPT